MVFPHCVNISFWQKLFVPTNQKHVAVFATEILSKSLREINQFTLTRENKKSRSSNFIFPLLKLNEWFPWDTFWQDLSGKDSNWASDWLPQIISTKMKCWLRYRAFCFFSIWNCPIGALFQSNLFWKHVSTAALLYSEMLFSIIDGLGNFCFYLLHHRWLFILHALHPLPPSLLAPPPPPPKIRKLLDLDRGEFPPIKSFLSLSFSPGKEIKIWGEGEKGSRVHRE